jgi:hypothetical protein
VASRSGPLICGRPQRGAECLAQEFVSGKIGSMKITAVRLLIVGGMTVLYLMVAVWGIVAHQYADPMFFGPMLAVALFAIYSVPRILRGPTPEERLEYKPYKPRRG